jgi:hypothetical protein
MAVSAIAALRGGFGDNGLTITFQCLEGNATASTVVGTRGSMGGVSYAAPIAKGDLVKLTTDCTWGVLPCAANDQGVLGVVVSDPVGDLEETMTQANQVTNKRLRTAVVLVFGQMVREVKTATNNTAIAIGDSVKHSATQVMKFDKDATANQTLALHAVGATTEATFPVLFGWYGAL